MSLGRPSLSFRWDEAPDVAAPVLVMGPSLGTNIAMLDAVAKPLATGWRVLRFDLPGHGRSRSLLEPTTVNELAGQVIRQLDESEVDRFSYFGISLSGAIGLSLALDFGQRLDSVAVCSSAPKFGKAKMWRDRAEFVRSNGAAALAAGAAERWFPSAFRRDEPARVTEVLEMIADSDNESYALLCDAIADFDVRMRLARITVPTLVMAGVFDPTTTSVESRAFAAQIPGAEFVELTKSAHIATTTEPDRIAMVLSEFLRRHRGGNP